MAKNIVIARLDIDTQSLIDSSQKSAKAIEDLREKQEKLVRKGKETSEQFIANAAGLKQLEAAHRAQIAAISAQINEDGKLVSVKKAVKEAVKEVNNSENDYVSNNQRLLALKKELNSNDENYEKRLAAINGKLHENNMWLEENGSKHAKLIMTMNDYKQQVADSFEQINIFNGGLSGLVSRAQEAGGVGPLLKGAFNGIGSGIMGMTKAAWGFVANPIGAILTAIVVAVQLGMAVFKNFTPVVEKVEQIMAALGAVVESVKNAFIGLFTGDASNFFSNLTTGAAEAAAEAMKLKEAEQELAKQMELQEIANEKAKNSIDELIAKSKDQTLSEEERIKALQDAAKKELENFNQRKAQVIEEERIATEKLANGKNLTANELKMLKEKGAEYAYELQRKKSISDEEIETLKKAQIAREKITSEETALTRRQAEDDKRFRDEIQAQKDQEAARERERRQKILDDALTKQKQLLNLYVAENALKSKTLAEQIQYEEEFAKKSKALLKTELRDKKISRIEYLTEIENLTAATSQRLAEIASNFANAELNLWMEENRSKIDSNKALTQEMADEEQQRLDNVYKKQLEQLEKEKNTNLETIELKKRLHQALNLQEIEFLTESERLTREHKEQTNALDQKVIEDKAVSDKKNRDEAASAEQQRLADKKALAKTDYDEQVIEEEMRHQAEIAKLEERKALGLISDTEFDALVEAEKKKSAENIKAIDRAVMDNKLSLASSTFGNLAAIMGKESAAGKAMAVAQATIDTYKSAVSAYSAMSAIPVVGPALGAVAAAAAVAAGIANVKKITATKPPKAEKGALFNIGGNRHSSGGTLFTGADGTQFEAERGELIGVMNRNAASHFMAFNNAFPAGGSSAPNYFASGGIVSREIAQQSMNMDELALKIAEANRTIPAPVVAVQDIINQGNSYVKVREAANF